jgi:hypothetical protein
VDSVKPSSYRFRARSETDDSGAIIALESHPSAPSRGVRGEDHLDEVVDERPVRVTLDVSLLRSVDGEKISDIMKGIRTLRELGAEVVVLYRSPKASELLDLRKRIESDETVSGLHPPRLSILKSPTIDPRTGRTNR